MILPLSVLHIASVTALAGSAAVLLVLGILFSIILAAIKRDQDKEAEMRSRSRFPRFPGDGPRFG